MITGADADVALLLVPAEMGGFETAIARGDHSTGEVQGQTRQHARLLGLLGIEKLIVELIRWTLAIGRNSVIMKSKKK